MEKRMLPNEIIPEEIKLDNHFKRASFAERSERDRNFYEKNYLVTDYQHSLTSDRAFINSLVKKYNIAGDRNFLDLGCGTGWYTNLLAELGFKVIGLDFSKTGITKAKKLYGNKILWVVGDAINMPFNSEKKFDTIFCCDFPPFNLVDDIPQAKEIANKLFKYLNKNGIFIFIWSSRLSGKREGDSVIIEYTRGQIREIFSDLGEILGDVYTTNKQLFPLLGKQAISKFITRLTTFGVKIHRKNVRIICGVKKKN